MTISRRDALLGATAAVAVAGVPGVALAIKAAGAKAALAGDPDADLLALSDRLAPALAAWTESRRRFNNTQYEADRTMPLEQPWLVGRTPAEQARKQAIYHRHMEAHGVQTLGRECAKLEGECGDLSAAVLRTRARTPAGIIRKLALVPYGRGSYLGPHWAMAYGEPDPVAFVVGSIRRDLESLAADLERLTAGMQS